MRRSMAAERSPMESALGPDEDRNYAAWAAGQQDDSLTGSAFNDHELRGDDTMSHKSARARGTPNSASRVLKKKKGVVEHDDESRDTRATTTTGHRGSRWGKKTY